MSDFAPGIPDKKDYGNIPRAQNTQWTLNIQRHDADKAGVHYDIRLSPPGSDEAYSWAARRLPGTGEKTLAVQQPVHKASYMGFSGEIEDGYGKGKVKSLSMEPVDILKASDNKIEFNRYQGQSAERYILLRRGSSKDWLFYNYTPSEKSKQYKDVPDYKYSYKSLDEREIRDDTSEEEEVWSPKLDGAHNLIVLRPDKRPDVFSYRSSKKGPERIDHTFKTDLWKTRAPKDLGKTIVRGELYVPGKRGNEAARILNSNTWKAREIQERERPLDIRIFDVVKYKGKDVEDLPYKEKLEMLRDVSTKVPKLKLPPTAHTPSEKKRMREEVMSGRHPLSAEGLVIYKMNESKPIKVKKKEDYDVKITGTYPAREGTKYEGEAIGGFIGIPEGSNTMIRFGSGLSDELRRSAYRDPEGYIGEWAKVESQHVHPSGKHQAPIFKELRSEKLMNKAANLRKLKDLITGKRLDKAKDLYRDANIDQFIHNHNVKRPAIQKRVRRGKNISPEYLDGLKYKERRLGDLENIVNNLVREQAKARLAAGAIAGTSATIGGANLIKRKYERDVEKMYKEAAPSRQALRMLRPVLEEAKKIKVPILRDGHIVRRTGKASDVGAYTSHFKLNPQTEILEEIGGHFVHIPKMRTFKDKILRRRKRAPNNIKQLTSTLAHEVGHAKDYVGGVGKPLEGGLKALNDTRYKNAPEVGKRYRNMLEFTASKNALEIFRKNKNLTPKEYKYIDKDLVRSYKTYDPTARKDVFSSYFKKLEKNK